MMTTELASAKAFLTGLSGGKPASVLCAVSGGLDSMCLLHLLSTWGREQGFSVTAAHFNHHLRGAASDRDEDFVRTWCAEHGVPFVSGQADVRALAAEEKLSPEEAGRSARYDFFAQQQLLGGHDFVLTAHHADDNAETMLLHLLRGTGLQGLTGIPARRGRIARPFLHLTRKDLTEYAKANGIPHVEDATNTDPDAAARNLLRLRVMPLLKELNPKAVENMNRTAELLAMDQQALDHAAQRLLHSAQIAPGCRAVLPLSGCTAHPAVLRRSVRSLLTQVCGKQKDLSTRHVESVCSLLENLPGKEVTLPYGMTARREADALVISLRPRPVADTAIKVGQSLPFGSWTVTLSSREGETELFLPTGADVQVTLWRRDDCMTLPGSRGKRSLKRLCADRGITPAQRDRLPILRVNGQAAAVPGIGTDRSFTMHSNAPVVFVTFYEEKEIKENGYEK